jgi:hypothetical protein
MLYRSCFSTPLYRTPLRRLKKKNDGLKLSGTFWSRLDSFYWEGTNKYTIIISIIIIIIIIIYLISASPFDIDSYVSLFFIKLFILDLV